MAKAPRVAVFGFKLLGEALWDSLELRLRGL